MWDWRCCGAPLAPWWWGRVGHPWHPGGGGVWATPGTLVVGACGEPLPPWWWGRVGHPLHPGGGGLWGTPGTLVVGACGAPPGTLVGHTSAGFGATVSYHSLHEQTNTHTALRHIYRVFFSQRLYKELTLTYAPLLPAIRDAHVGSHDYWAVEDNDVVLL